MSLELLGSASGGQANGVSIGDLAKIGSLIWKNPGNMSTLLVGALEHFFQIFPYLGDFMEFHHSN